MMVCLCNPCCTAVQTLCYIASVQQNGQLPNAHVGRCPHCWEAMGAEDTEASRRIIHLREPSASTVVAPTPQPLLPQTLPPATAAHVLSPSELAACQSRLREWNNAGIIEPSASFLAQDQDPCTQAPSDDDCLGAENSTSFGVNITAPPSAFDH